MRLPVAIFLFAIFMEGCEQKDASKTSSQDVLITKQADSSQFTSIEWKEQTIDFGKITEGQKLEVAYHFKNTGTRPLVISKVEPGCGCTVAETPNEPIAPGKEGTIKGAFDSNGRLGPQHKSIFVSANTTGTQNHELVFTVEVNKKSN